MIRNPQIYVADEMERGGGIVRRTYLFDGDEPNPIAQFNQELNEDQILRIAQILNEDA